MLEYTLVIELNGRPAQYMLYLSVSRFNCFASFFELFLEGLIEFNS